MTSKEKFIEYWKEKEFKDKDAYRKKHPEITEQELQFMFDDEYEYQILYEDGIYELNKRYIDTYYIMYYDELEQYHEYEFFSLEDALSAKVLINAECMYDILELHDYPIINVGDIITNNAEWEKRASQKL